MLPEGREKGEIEFLIAKNLSDADNLTAARLALGELRQKYADTAIALDSTILLGEMMIKYGRFDTADEILQELVREAPRTAHAGKAMLMLAGAAAERGEYDLAIGYCEEWFKHSPTSQDELDIMLLFAQAKLETGAPEEAVSLASEIFMSYQESPRLAKACMLMGRAYEALNDPEKAESCYTNAAERDPADWSPHWRLSRLRSSESKWPEAIELMTHAVELAPNEESLLLELTRLYRLSGDEAAAFSILETFTRERQLSLHIDEAYLMLADIHQRRGSLQDTYRTLERLEAIGASTTDLPSVYEWQGDILCAAGIHGDAVEKYRMAVEKGADGEALKFKIARTLLTIGKAQDCLEELTEISLATQPVEEQFDFFDLKARALMKLGRYAEARTATLKGIDLRSGQEKFSTLASLMQANLALKDDDAASDIYELTLKLIETDDPESQAPSESRHIILSWARHLYDNGEYVRASDVYSRVGMPKFPIADAAWALYQQGNCHFHMADYDGASEYYSLLATRFTDSEWVAFAKTKERLIGVAEGS
jgi:tetratricopeptide (TPR) repeat protein